MDGDYVVVQCASRRWRAHTDDLVAGLGRTVKRPAKDDQPVIRWRVTRIRKRGHFIGPVDARDIEEAWQLGRDRWGIPEQDKPRISSTARIAARRSRGGIKIARRITPKGLDVEIGPTGLRERVVEECGNVAEFYRLKDLLARLDVRSQSTVPHCRCAFRRRGNISHLERLADLTTFALQLPLQLTLMSA